MKLDFDKLTDPTVMLEAALPLLINLASALAIFFIGKWIASFVIGLVKKAMAKGKMDETLASFLGNVFYGLALAVIVISALG